MQERHQNRNIYFKELSITSRNYFIPYIQYWHTIEAKMNVLEIGCGDGGNLLPFSEIGCNTVGVDIAQSRIKDAKTFFNALIKPAHMDAVQQAVVQLQAKQQAGAAPLLLPAAPGRPGYRVGGIHILLVFQGCEGEPGQAGEVDELIPVPGAGGDELGLGDLVFLHQQIVQRAFDIAFESVGYVDIPFCRLDIVMSHKLFHYLDVGSLLQQVSGERMAQQVRINPFRDSRFPGRCLQPFRHDTLGENPRSLFPRTR